MSSSCRTSRRARPAANLAAAVLLLAPLGAACTTSATVRPPGSLSSPGVTVAGPSATLVEEAAQCALTQELDQSDPAALPISGTFRGFSGVGTSPPVEQRPGPDAADPSRCPGDLPDEIFCDTPVPWSGLGGSAFLTASGATRSISQQGVIVPDEATPDADGITVDGQTLTYRQLDLAPGDPKGLVSYLQRAFSRCARAKPTTVNGLKAVAGRAPSFTASPTPAHHLLFVQGRRVAWALFDGTGWNAASRAHALRVVTHHLKSATTA